VIDHTTTFSIFTELAELSAALFLLTSFGIIAMRQVQASLIMFILQSLLLAMSAIILGYQYTINHLFVVAGVTVVIKCMLLPWLLRYTIRKEVYARREILQVLNIPTSLLIAVAITIFAYFITSPLLKLSNDVAIQFNLPIGLAVLLLGAYTIMVRTEAVPQVIGIISMENGAFFAGISIASNLPLIAELAAAFDVLIIALVMGILISKIHEHTGDTSIKKMTILKEG
jgi:hydrogenase-4 component E